MLFITIVSALLSAVLAAPAAAARPNTPPRDQLRISKLTFQSTDTGIGDAHDFKFQLQVGSVMVQCNDLPGPKTNFHSREVDCHNKDFTVFVQDFGTQKLLHVKFLDREAGQEKVAWNIAPSYKCPKGSGVKVRTFARQLAVFPFTQL